MTPLHEVVRFLEQLNLLLHQLTPIIAWFGQLQS
jgi:hypothetical protein